MRSVLTSTVVDTHSNSRLLLWYDRFNDYSVNKVSILQCLTKLLDQLFQLFI